MRHLATASAAALLLLVAPRCACGPSSPSGDDGGVPDAGPYTSGSVCEQLATAQCALVERCFPAFARLSKDDCIAAQKAACARELSPVVKSVNAGRAKPDQAAVDSCVNRMSKTPCAAALPPTVPPIAARIFDDCSPVLLYMGSLAEGQVCRSPADCAPGNTCRQPSGTCAGVCVALSKAGEMCLAGCDPKTAWCDDTQSPATCSPYKGENGTCQNSNECQANLACKGGACVAPPGQGQACSFVWDRIAYCSAGLACDVAPYLDGLSSTCVLRQEAGKACHYHWSCKENLVCRGMNWGPFPMGAPGPGACGAPAAEGEGCSPTAYAIYVGDECAPGLACDAVAKTCKKRPAVGEACEPTTQNCIGADTWCRTGASTSATCGGRPAQGETCAWALDPKHVVTIPCADGWCDLANYGKCAPASLKDGDPCTEDAACISGRCGVNEDQSRTCWPKCTG